MKKVIGVSRKDLIDAAASVLKDMRREMPRVLLIWTDHEIADLLVRVSNLVDWDYEASKRTDGTCRIEIWKIPDECTVASHDVILRCNDIRQGKFSHQGYNVEEKDGYWANPKLARRAAQLVEQMWPLSKTDTIYIEIPQIKN